MSRQPIKIEIVEEAEGRFVVITFADGEEKRVPVVKLPRKQRYPPRPYRHWDLDSSKKKSD